MITPCEMVANKAQVSEATKIQGTSKLHHLLFPSVCPTHFSLDLTILLKSSKHKTMINSFWDISVLVVPKSVPGWLLQDFRKNP